MTGEAPIRFRRSSADDAAVAPRAAGEAAEDELLDPIVRGAIANDRRVATVVDMGWCLYSPADVRLDPAGDPRVTPSEAGEYVTVDENRSTETLLAVTVDTLWTVDVDESCPVLVLPWSGRLENRVTSQLITAADGPIELDIPIATREALPIERDVPLVQVVPVPEPLLDAPFEAGVPSDESEINWG